MRINKKIIVSVSNDLTTDQRLDRICNSLTKMDFEILLVGRKLKNSHSINNRKYKTKRFRLLFNKGFLFYACLNIRLFLFLLFSKSDILLANDLDTLPANYLAAKLKRKILIYDSHELFTEVPELNNRKSVKKIWLKIEKICLPRVNSAYTVCKSIADYYNNQYDVKFHVIRNLPIYAEYKTHIDERKNILIYQGALNKDRGLELLIRAMQFIEDYKLIIAGDGDIACQLKYHAKEMQLTEKIEFSGKLNFNELYKLSSSAKLGFSLERDTNLNYRYALPNKIFDYINTGTPVLCSDLPEMKDIIEKYKCGEIFKGNNPKQLAEQILSMLKNREQLEYYHINCIQASKELCWEKEENRLDLVRVSLQVKPD
jgi:glycosyltransferase involved in cell wall biosynthesis